VRVVAARTGVELIEYLDFVRNKPAATFEAKVRV
jgi:hypothetical protein